MKKNLLTVCCMILILILFISTIVYASNYDNENYRLLFRLIHGRNRLAIPKQEKELPVLMYHHIGAEENDVTISVSLFQEHLGAMQQEGYTPISLQQLIDFVNGNGVLPEKPVLITFDDGYLSNYTYAFPLLQEYEMPATIFVIGSSVGHTQYYKDTNYLLTPHFSYEEAKEMEDSGWITIESHTYDMHQWKPFESGEMIRETAVRLDGESDEDFELALQQDHELMQEDFREYLQKDIIAFAYPRGMYDSLSERIFEDLGVKVTFGTEEGINVVRQNDFSSLRCMKRYNMNDEISVEQLMKILENQ